MAHHRHTRSLPSLRIARCVTCRGHHQGDHFYARYHEAAYMKSPCRLETGRKLTRRRTRGRKWRLYTLCRNSSPTSPPTCSRSSWSLLGNKSSRRPCQAALVRHSRFLLHTMAPQTKTSHGLQGRPYSTSWTNSTAQHAIPTLTQREPTRRHILFRWWCRDSVRESKHWSVRTALVRLFFSCHPCPCGHYGI